jgi:hypothetical protein
VTATVDDGRLGVLIGPAEVDEPVRPVSYAVTGLVEPPLDLGEAALALAPADGNYDSTVEQVMGSVDTTCLPTGRHLLFVQGQDAAGQWGPAAVTFVTVTNSSPLQLSAAPAGSAFAGRDAHLTLTVTNTAEFSATYALSVTSAVSVGLPVTTTTVAPGSQITLDLRISLPNHSAGTAVPATVKVYSVSEPAVCRKVDVMLAARARLLFPLMHLADEAVPDP